MEIKMNVNYMCHKKVIDTSKIIKNTKMATTSILM